MSKAVIVSTARTPLAKSWKGAFNMTHGATLGGFAVKAAVERAGIDSAAVEDVLMGCATPEGATGSNIARQIALAAGLPITTSGVTVNRFCSSGLQTIAMASQRIIAGEGDVYVAGGVESISCVQNEANRHMIADPALLAKKPEIYWNMLQTAENVARRYKIDKQRMDEYGAASQQKACAAQEKGLFNDEMVSVTVTAGVADPVMGLRSKEVTVKADEGLRPGTTYDGIKGIRSAMPGGVVTAGNASQFSDGAGACVVVDEAYASKHGLKPIGRFLGFAVAGCEPDEMGIGPVYRGAQGAQAPGPEGERHRPVGAERGLRSAGAVLRRHARPADGPAQRQRWRDRGRPPLWRERAATDRSCPDRGQASRRQEGLRDDVHRWWHGGGRRLRSAVNRDAA